MYIEFLEPIKNRVSAKSVLKEALYNEALLYICCRSPLYFLNCPKHMLFNYSVLFLQENLLMQKSRPSTVPYNAKGFFADFA